MIVIHYDFTDGTEVSYAEGLLLKDHFTTCCLDFFTTENEARDVVILCKNENVIYRNKLMLNDGTYTVKEIRPSHNILKMFKAGSFKWENFSDYKTKFEKETNEMFELQKTRHQKRVKKLNTQLLKNVRKREW